MLTTSNIRDKYEKIQKQLYYMIPEKWDRVYLYASVVDHFNGLQTGEMFFYYFPKSIIKKNPINVYEVPSKFNIDEKSYLKLAEKLYSEIKELRKEQIEAGEKKWSNLTISIENFKFNVEYHYENLQDTKYTSYDRHLIWRYKYLDIPLSSYTKKERKMIEEYLNQNTHKNNSNTYQEGIYKKPVSNIIEYNNVNVGAGLVSAPEPENSNVGVGALAEAQPQTGKYNKNMNEQPNNKTKYTTTQIDEQKTNTEEHTIKSQILNTHI